MIYGIDKLWNGLSWRVKYNLIQDNLEADTIEVATMMAGLDWDALGKLPHGDTYQRELNDIITKIYEKNQVYRLQKSELRKMDIGDGDMASHRRWTDPPNIKRMRAEIMTLERQSGTPVDSSRYKHFENMPPKRVEELYNKWKRRGAFKSLTKYGRATEYMVVFETPSVLKRFAARYEDPASVILPMLSRDLDGKVTALTIGKVVTAMQMNSRAHRILLEKFPHERVEGGFSEKKFGEYLRRKIGFGMKSKALTVTDRGGMIVRIWYPIMLTSNPNHPKATSGYTAYGEENQVSQFIQAAKDSRGSLGGGPGNRGVYRVDQNEGHIIEVLYEPPTMKKPWTKGLKNPGKPKNRQSHHIRETTRLERDWKYLASIGHSSHEREARARRVQRYHKLAATRQGEDLLNEYYQGLY